MKGVLQLNTKKIPLRHCVACNAEKPKAEFARVVRSSEGEISLDVTGKKPGRGAYICKDAACLAKAQKSKRLERILKCEISPEIYELLHAEIEGEGS